jgi:hypothetical protein
VRGVVQLATNAGVFVAAMLDVALRVPHVLDLRALESALGDASQELR